MARLDAISRALASAGLDGWLFYDFRFSDPLAYRILEIPDRGLTTRRWFYFVAANKPPQALVSSVEAHRLDTLPASPRLIYRSERQMIDGLAAMLRDCRRIAMNYSPYCAIPYVSRVDAGTLELVRSIGVEVVSAADLIQHFEATLTPAQIASHRRAAAMLRDIVEETFAEVARRVRGCLPCTEYQMQRFVLERIERRQLRTDELPIVAVNVNASNPHFTPTEANDTPIRPGDLVLLDIFAKELAPDSIYGDLTWMGFVDQTVPDDYARIFEIVARARDAAVELIQTRVRQMRTVTGADADRAARSVIEDAGYGEFFVHRTGHSIGREVHGNGANLDSLETQDLRSLIDRTCFSVEPGIYLPDRFGLRSELDMTIEAGRAEISGGAIQPQIIPILGTAWAC
jgi:Xaa-Pro dipeptidase